MAYKTNLDACINRYHHQVKIMDEYLKTIQEPLMKSEDKKIIQFALESLAIRIMGFLDEYLKCLIGLASVRQEKLTRQYFIKYGDPYKQSQVKSGCNLGMLWKFSETEVSFKNKAKKLKRIFNYLFGFSPFPDEKTENLILDMVLIRNIIIHVGSWPSESHAGQIITPGIIIVSNEIDLKKDNSKPIKFYKLKLTEPKFLKDAVLAAGDVAFYIQSQLENDPRFSFIKRREKKNEKFI